MNRGGQYNKIVHVINVEIKDRHEEAFLAGKAILDLAKAASRSPLAVDAAVDKSALNRSKTQKTSMWRWKIS